jgi:Nucleotidyltransferase
MNPTGEADDAKLLVAARSALLDALDALAQLREAVVVIGAQAIYLHTGGAAVALAEATKDSDLALDPGRLALAPLIEQAMTRAGFRPNTTTGQPGAWLNNDGIPVDLMVPDALSGPGGRRGARIPPHSSSAARRATGLEAAVVDHVPMVVRSLDPVDVRAVTANVAGPAALLVAKLHKLAERRATPDRLANKDAHDIYRLLVAISTETLRESLERLVIDPLAGGVTQRAMSHLDELFASGPDALGSAMAGKAEELVGEPETVAVSVSTLADDLVRSLGCGRPGPNPTS